MTGILEALALLTAVQNTSSGLIMLINKAISEQRDLTKAELEVLKAQRENIEADFATELERRRLLSGDVLLEDRKD